MTGIGVAMLLLAGTGIAQQSRDQGRAPDPLASVQLARVSVRERVIIRVQTMTPRASRKFAPPKRVKWKERRADRCVAVSALANATVNDGNSVDLILRTGSRLRAKLESDCPALDFYTGLYLKPNRDGKVCADRDIIYARSGSQCEITAFRTLVPDR